MSGRSAYESRGAKMEWRRRVWNEIRRRVPDPSTAVVLWLPGPTPESELAKAEKAGFRRRNMIGVESELDTYKSLRRRGFNVIHGDVYDVLWSWPKARALDVVNLDLTGPPKAQKLWHIYPDLTISAPGAVWAVNVLRGRERDGLYKSHIEMPGLVDAKEKGVTRAFSLFSLMISSASIHEAWRLARDGWLLTPWANEYIFDRRVGPKPLFVKHSVQQARIAAPYFTTYRSLSGTGRRGSTFETVVWTKGQDGVRLERPVNRSAAAYLAHITMARRGANEIRRI